MTSLSGLLYDPFVRLLRAASPLVGGGESKLARSVRGREGAALRLEMWGRDARDRERSLIWFHVPSVGEGLQARAVLDALRERGAPFQSVLTHFSASAEDLARKAPVDASDYLPWDVRAELRPLLGAVRPSVIAFTRTEVWPGLAAEAVAAGVPIVLIAATLPARSSRLNPLVRPFLRPAFGTLARVFAISDEDGARFLRLGVPEDRIEVTGDPGVDSAWARVRAADPAAAHLRPFRADPQPTLVAGSTWGEDEAVLVPALAAVREHFPALRAILAPHEPGEAHLRRLEEALRAAGLRSRRLAEVEREGSVSGTDVVIVDRVGVLASLYTVGGIAYVGGGFGTDGLHSVLEPAAAALPTLFGPRHEGSRGAMDLIRARGGAAVGDARELADALERWLSTPALREKASEQARRYIEAHRGASRRTADALSRFFSTSQGARS
ncbi:MAG: glycosyltransferase N-terminal domain-containing protein [Gemmatimonadota bacterium]